MNTEAAGLSAAFNLYSPFKLASVLLLCRGSAGAQRHQHTQTNTYALPRLPGRSQSHLSSGMSVFVVLRAPISN